MVNALQSYANRRNPFESFIALWDRRVQDTGNMLARMVQIVTEPLNGNSQLIREID